MCVQCYGECSILRTVSAHLMDRRRYHNLLGAVQHVRAIIDAFKDVQFCEGISSLLGGIISTAKGTHYNEGKIDHKLQHSIDDILL